MDIKNSLAMKKKRELLGSISKRKMSLRKNIDNLKQNECRLDITQITKCVFLGSLCLKPVPQLFDSPLLLEELDMKVGNVKCDVTINNENINGTVLPMNNKKQNSTNESVKRAGKQKSSPKVRKKSLRERNDVKTTPNGVSKTIKLESIPVEPQQNVINITKNSKEITETLPHTKNNNNLTPPILPEIDVIPREQQIAELSMTPNKPSPPENIDRNVDRDIPFEEVMLDLKLFNQNVTEEPNNTSNDGAPPDIKTINEVKTIDEVALRYEDLERLKREPTPEIILSDSDEDAIDQLMFNIMDIKVGPDDFGKDFFDVPTSDIEQYSEEYSNDSNNKSTNLPAEDDSPSKDDKKLIKRNPQCKICSQVFSSYVQLKKHKESHGGDKPYVCLKCNENHTTLDQLIAHLRTHQGKRPYVCKKCNEGFRTMKALENHQPVHVLRKAVPQRKAYQCEVCAKEFRKLCDLERHTRVHTGEKPSVCNICNRRFQQAHNLNKHLLIHTKEKPFECDICNKRFGRNDVLNRHLLTHSVKKPNQCKICMKSFIRVSQLLAHKDKYHEERAS